MIKRLGLDKYSALYLWAFFIIVFGTWHPDTFLTMTSAKTILIENVIVGFLADSVGNFAGDALGSTTDVVADSGLVDLVSDGIGAIVDGIFS